MEFLKFSWINWKHLFLLFVTIFYKKQTDKKNTVFLDLGAFEALLLVYGNILRLFRNEFSNASYKLLTFFIIFPYLTVEPHLTHDRWKRNTYLKPLQNC